MRVVRDKAEREGRSRLKALGKISASFGGWKPAHEVLHNVRAIPTIFPHVNAVSEIAGGWPIARVSLAHGESGDGKSKFGLGLGMSFLLDASVFGLVDAEQTTPFDWTAQLMGDVARSPGFVALRPRTYEETRAEVRRLCERVAEAREKREVDPRTTALVMVDSIRKLVPKNIWDELSAETAGKEKRARGGRKPAARGIDGMGGRAAQIKAALNAAWMDELIVLLAQTDTAMLIIARETLDDDGRIKIGGGKSLYYDSSLVVRVERDGWITDGAEKDAAIYGERHAVVVHKTKVAGREQRWPTAYFHSSNGKLDGVPAGFDRPRDVLELALSRAVVDAKGGGWLDFEGESLGQGANKAVQRLHADPALVLRLEAAIEASRPVEAVGEVVEQPAD